MKTNADVELDLLAPFTYSLESAPPHPSWEWELGGPDEAPRAETETDAETVYEAPAAGESSASDLGYFMEMAGRYPLLSAEEERALGLTLWRCRRGLVRVLRQLRGLGGDRRPARSREPRFEMGAHRAPITASTRRRLARVEALARKALTPTGAGDAKRDAARARLAATVAELDDARRRLVEHNLRLVVWVAKRFRGRGFDFIDVIQEGSLGLMRAIDRYDPLVGARFSTFATHWIQQGIRRALAEKARTVRIPVNRIAEAREALLVRANLSSRLGRPARAEEIATAMGAEPRKIRELLPALAPFESIDAPVAPSDRTLAERIPDRARPAPLDHAMLEETRRAVHTVLHELPQRERVILAMRHGIGYPKECTLEEIGEALGLSRERIRQVEKTATASVREWIREHRPALAAPV